MTSCQEENLSQVVMTLIHKHVEPPCAMRRHMLAHAFRTGRPRHGCFISRFTKLCVSVCEICTKNIHVQIRGKISAAKQATFSCCSATTNCIHMHSNSGSRLLATNCINYQANLSRVCSEGKKFHNENIAKRNAVVSCRISKNVSCLFLRKGGVTVLLKKKNRSVFYC